MISKTPSRRPNALLVLLCLLAVRPLAGAESTTYKFDFGPGKVAPGYTQILPETVYSKESGYGFEPGVVIKGEDRGGDDALRSDFCTSDQPFYFSVNLPEGNYTVTVTMGDLKEATRTTIKAELRRLMVEKAETAAGKFETRSFTVNLRQPQIASGGTVRLKDREKTQEIWAWDDRLTLEFNDKHPVICSLEIAKAAETPTLYLLGDSTVADQSREPYNSWGQMLPRFFKAGLAVANHSESGESLKSSWGAERLEKVVSLLKPNEYVFLQFGHNDEKEKGEGVGAFTTYKTDLKKYVAEIRKHGGRPVLITPMHRRTFGPDGTVTNSHGDYPEAVRQAAAEEQVPLIDLNAMSKPFYEALGPEKSKLAFKDGDATHHNNYGSYQLAKCIVQGIRQNKLGIEKYLMDEIPPFDPAHPDSVETFEFPASPPSSSDKPYGS